MDALVQHFIYPLSHAGGYVFEGGRQITPDNYWASSLVGKTDEWGMSTGYRLIEPGDWVWAYFSQPIAQILGVGRVVKPVTWHARWGRYSVHIRWDRALTSALKKKPIDYAEYQQQVQGAAVRANKSTVQVLEGWLLDHGSRWVSEARAVKFAQREVLQRLGQAEFRARVLKAYGGTCAITGTTEEGVLQAAHILPIGNGGRHTVANSLLLRADVHNLFDLGLLTITPGMKVAVDPTVTDGIYRGLVGRPVSVPRAVNRQELKKALTEHRSRRNK
ncbi:MAG: HNH endonuclease [Actinomycetales bacterium]|uniref:HNH endonuclease n=1 Tax=Candidatus Phosphoribacter hodrii TaxID=2953743 RepID=A0A935CDZ7_9MICO|nr:HNH endonuclease [Candidatus Phosphoribacter hodrii]OPZ56150.1 MAG: hypothetical protein BWY91_00565 [bacterium ADurb.BinA028]HOA58141.1 HNH endonuclease [Dermatophilaceae bacterium]MBK7272114.1 HNH endonuclease [Candidatus Phosphoribacter hodrii]HOR15657.1 HNH endonuclease [Dermatophilaceae bacterium]